MKELLALLQQEHPSWELDESRIAYWAKAFQDVPDRDLLEAGRRSLEDSDRRPSIAGIFKALRSLKDATPKDPGNPLTHFDGEPRFRDRWGEGGEPQSGIPPAPVFQDHQERAEWRKKNGYYDAATPYHPGQFVRTPPGPALPEPPPEFVFFQRADGNYELRLREGCAFPERWSWKHPPWNKLEGNGASVSEVW